PEVIDLDDDEEDEDEEISPEEMKSAEELLEEEVGQGADDALGLYLRQMGSIPLLNRQQEIALAQKLEFVRDRFRKAALSCGYLLTKVMTTFERVQAGQITLDPVIDIVTSLGLTRERIIQRLPYNVRTLKHALKKLAEDHRDTAAANTAAAR